MLESIPQAFCAEILLDDRQVFGMARMRASPFLPPTSRLPLDTLPLVMPGTPARRAVLLIVLDPLGLRASRR